MNLEKLSLRELEALERQIVDLKARKRPETIRELRERFAAMAKEKGLSVAEVAAAPMPKVLVMKPPRPKDAPREVLFDPVSKLKYMGRGRPPTGFEFTRAKPLSAQT